MPSRSGQPALAVVSMARAPSVPTTSHAQPEPKCPTAAALTVEDLVILHGNIQALETGSDTIATMFPPERAERERGKLSPEDLKPGTEANRGHGDERLGDVAPHTEPPTEAPPTADKSDAKRMPRQKQRGLELAAEPDAAAGVDEVV